MLRHHWLRITATRGYLDGLAEGIGGAGGVSRNAVADEAEDMAAVAWGVTGGKSVT